MGVGPGWKMFDWVPDGTYDYTGYWIRYVIVDGMPTTIITMMWLNQGGPTDVPEELRQPWGSFPDMPPKPQKK